MLLFLLFKIIRFLILSPLFWLLQCFNKAQVKHFTYNNKTNYDQATEYDCETVAILNALFKEEDPKYAQELYDEINRALLRCECLGWLQNPLYGNPWNVRIALEELGYEVENIVPDNIHEEDKVIMLIHLRDDPAGHILHQHWIARTRRDDWQFGDGVMCHVLTKKLVKDYWRCKLYPTCYVIRERKCS